MRSLSRIVLITGAFGILAFLPEPETTLFWAALYDVGHAALFAAIIWLLRGVRRVASDRKALILTLLLAGGSEILQLGQAARDASVEDFLRDAAGAIAFLLLNASRVARRPRQERSKLANVRPLALRLAAGGLLTLVIIPFLIVCGIYIQRDRAFPTLYRLDDSWWERRLISTGDATLVPATTAPPRENADRAATPAMLLLRPAEYPGLFFDEPVPDWTRFRRLALTVVSPEVTPLTLTIRIHDRTHDQRFEDRFNTRVVIHTGENRVVIPLEEIRRAPVGREMDMRHIRGIGLYVHHLDHPARLYLGPLALE